MTLTNTFSEVWAIPGKPGIIDAINPATGLTVHFANDEAGVKARYPDAVRYRWSDWHEQASRAQQTPIVWQLTTRESYHYMLDILPPAAWKGGAFLVGEPADHDVATGAPRFTAFWENLHRRLGIRSTLNWESGRSSLLLLFAPALADNPEGMDRLAHAVSDSLTRTFMDVDVEMGIDNGRLMAYLAAHGEVLSRRYHEGNRVTLHCRVPKKYLAVLREDSSVQILERLGGSMAVEEVA
jgi:hypothetical protein